MATLFELETDGSLQRIRVRLDRNQQPLRTLYGTPLFIGWLQTDVSGLVSDRHLDETPKQQMLNLAVDFISGGPMPFDRRFKPWRKMDRGIWYLKTPDLRIFGWFPLKDHFVAAFGDTKHRCQEHNLYAGYCDQVVRVRDALPLDPPKFIEGGNPDDVVSF